MVPNIPPGPRSATRGPIRLRSPGAGGMLVPVAASSVGRRHPRLSAPRSSAPTSATSTDAPTVPKSSRSIFAHKLKTPAAEPRIASAPPVGTMADAALRRDEARYRTLVRALTQVVWTAGANGEFVEPQASWAEYTGQPAEEALGWGWLDGIHPDDRARIGQTWRRAVGARAVFHAEFRLTRSDGVMRWVVARAAPVLGEGPDAPVLEYIGTITDVDELRRATEERARLLEGERRSRSEAERLSERLVDTLESVSDAFVAYDHEWRIVRMNSAGRRSLAESGVDPDGAIGRSLWEVFPGLEHSRTGQQLMRAAADRVAVQFEERAADGIHWLETHVYPTREGVAVWTLDVTERHRAHAAEHGARVDAERANARLRAVQDLSDAAASEESLDDMLHTLAERVCKTLQTDSATVLLRIEGSDELMVRTSLGMEEEVAGRDRVRIGECFAGRVAAARAPLVVADATDFPVRPMLRHAGLVSLAGVPLIASGGLIGVLHVGTHDLRDFTEDDVRLLQLVADRVAIAIERAQILEAERCARAEAERANRAKMEFLAMMSHELRTPLNAIAGYAELLELGLRGPVTEAQLTDLRAIRRNEQHLLSLIEEVLSYAKLDAGRVHLDLGEIRVSAAVESSISIVASQIERKGLRLTTQLGDADLVVMADLEKLQQIIVNLLSNATKFTPLGGEIVVQADSLGDRVSIRVRDSGIGIPREQHERIFEPFVQLETGLARRSAGTGLGLAISRELARAMRGDLTVISEPGAGAEFTLTLPRRARVEPPEL